MSGREARKDASPGAKAAPNARFNSMPPGKAMGNGIRPAFANPPETSRLGTPLRDRLLTR